MAQLTGELSRTELRFSVLGPLTAEAGGVGIPLGPLKQRLVLAALLCHANTPVSVDRLTAIVWDGEPPRTARKNIQVHVAALRKLLARAGAPRRLELVAGGYELRVGEDELDVLRFQSLARAGRDALSSGALAAAARSLRRALDQWRGRPLPELTSSQALADEAERWHGRYLQVYEDWAETELRIGNAGLVVGTIDDLAERHPFRERLRGAQMRVLHSLGRQTEALAVYDDVRRLLSAELGVEPSPALAALYQSMLAGAEYGPRWAPAAAGPASGGHALLPPDPPDLTGREAQRAELLAALDQADRRLTVITGPAGAGKTVFAVHMAHRLAGRYPDGRLLIRMRDADGAPRPWPAILAELARLNGTGSLAADDPERAAAAWRLWLAHQAMLLILDDAADEASVRPLVPDAGRSTVIVTARARLAGLESAARLEMLPFTADEALDLLRRVLGPDRLAGQEQAAQRIIAATGMLPLAVRASALKLSVLRHLPLAEYAARLADPDTLLDELTAGDVSVRDRVAAGWRDLSGRTQQVLALLATLPVGPFTVADAAVVLGRGHDAARRDVESLIDDGVISPPCHEVAAHAARYELPRLTHVYARELLRAGAGPAMAGHHPSWPGDLPVPNRRGPRAKAPRPQTCPS